MGLVAPISIDLHAHGSAASAAIVGIPELADAERAAAIATWRGRMVNEHISARVFAALLQQMMRAGLPAEWLAAVADASVDELRHGRQCAAVVVALGGEARAQINQLDEVPEHSDVSALEAVCRNALSISCLSETVAVALITSERERAGVASIRETLSTILADEVKHARTGWRIVEHALTSMDERAIERMDRYLVVALRHLCAHELSHLPAVGAISDRAESVGVCDGHLARGLFFDTVASVILPRLQSLGLQAHRAWELSGGQALAQQHTAMPAGNCEPLATVSIGAAQ